MFIFSLTTCLLFLIICKGSVIKDQIQTGNYINITSFWMIVKEGPTLFSLKRVAQESQKARNDFAASTMGVIVDVTAPVYRERDKDFITEVKIVDETINQCQVYGVMVRHLSVYIFSQKEEEILFCNRIGQIVYLQKFIFTLWHNIKFETKYLSRTQNFHCFQVQGENLKLLGSVNAMGKVYADYESVTRRGINLHQWFMNFFFRQYHPTLGISLMNNFTLMAEPFCLILKLLSPEDDPELLTEDRTKQDTEVYRFRDGNKNTFFINKSQVKFGLPKNQYLLLRGVKCICHFYEIMLTPTGNILGLPQQRAKQYEEAMNYCAISRFNQRFLKKNHQLCLLSRVNYIPSKVTPIADLMKQAQLYENRQSSRDEIRLEDYYMVEAVAINFQGNLHMFHTEHQIIIDTEFIRTLTDDEKKEIIEENKISYLYEGILGVIDRSSESTGKLFNIHLFSNQRRTQFFDPALIDTLIKEAGSEFSIQLEKMVKQKIEDKLSNLIKKSSFSNTITMLLEPIKTDTLIYRLSNTIFD